MPNNIVGQYDLADALSPLCRAISNRRADSLIASLFGIMLCSRSIGHVAPLLGLLDWGPFQKHVWALESKSSYIFMSE